MRMIHVRLQKRLALRRIVRRRPARKRDESELALRQQVAQRVRIGILFKRRRAQLNARKTVCGNILDSLRVPVAPRDGRAAKSDLRLAAIERNIEGRQIDGRIKWLRCQTGACRARRRCQRARARQTRRQGI